MKRRLLYFLNPLERLGVREYSFFFPFIVTATVFILLEIYVTLILNDPDSLGLFAIFIAMFSIFYFSLRDGIRGGLIPTTIAIAFYLYIMYSRNYTGDELEAGLITTGILAVLYAALSLTIGGLRQKLDSLIERESDENRRLQTIIDQLPVGVIISDSHGVVTNGNKHLNTLLGKTVRKGMRAGVDTLPYATNGQKEYRREDSPLYISLTKKKPVLNKEFKIVRPDKTHSYVQINATPIKNASGKIIAAASILTDVTERKETEMRKDDFVNMASHELKTPLTSMKLYIDILSKQLVKINDQKGLRLIKSVDYQTDRLEDIVRDLLDASRIRTGKLTFNFETFSLGDVIRETIDAVQGASKHKILFSEKKTPYTVYADRFRIYQVITNLLTNAIKYSPENTPIVVDMQKSEDKVIVSVQDKGLGVAQSHQKKIFDRLYQVTDPTVKTFPGLGIGLYISKEIVRRHRGRIWVESEVGKGSTFFFTLPTRKSSRNTSK